MHEEGLRNRQTLAWDEVEAIQLTNDITTFHCKNGAVLTLHGTGEPLPGATIAVRSYEYNFECGTSTTPDCRYRRDPEFWFKLLPSIGLNWNWDL